MNWKGRALTDRRQYEPETQEDRKQSPRARFFEFEFDSHPDFSVSRSVRVRSISTFLTVSTQLAIQSVTIDQKAAAKNSDRDLHHM
jgi:hypothetical protein